MGLVSPKSVSVLAAGCLATLIVHLLQNNTSIVIDADTAAATQGLLTYVLQAFFPHNSTSSGAVPQEG